MSKKRKPKVTDHYDPDTGEFDVQSYDDEMDDWENEEIDKSERRRDFNDSYFFDDEED